MNCTFVKKIGALITSGEFEIFFCCIFNIKNPAVGNPDPLFRKQFPQHLERADTFHAVSQNKN